MILTPPDPPPCLLVFSPFKRPHSGKAEEWLKSSEKPKVELICTPHKLPLKKITTRTSLTLQLTHPFPPQLPQTTQTTQLPQPFRPLFNFYHTKPGIHPLFNSPGRESSWWVSDISHSSVEAYSLNSMSLFDRTFTDKSSTASALVAHGGGGGK